MNELATKLQRLYPCFWGFSTQLYYTQYHRKLFFSCKSNMAATKPEILLYQRRDELETTFQRLYPCFQWFSAQLSYMHHHRKLFSAANPRWRLENRNSYHFLMVQPAVINSYSLVSRDCRPLVLMSLLLVLECIGISNIAAAKPEVHV